MKSISCSEDLIVDSFLFSHFIRAVVDIFLFVWNNFFFKGGTGDLSRTGSVAGGLGGIVSGGFLKLGYIPVSQVYIFWYIYKQTSIFIKRKDKTNFYISYLQAVSQCEGKARWLFEIQNYNKDRSFKPTLSLGSQFPNLVRICFFLQVFGGKSCRASSKAGGGAVCRGFCRSWS